MSIIDDSYDLNKPYFQNHSYLEWLKSFTIDETAPPNSRDTYENLLNKLWSIPYIQRDGGVGNDDDRRVEGLELRYRYNYILMGKSGFSDYGDIDTSEMFGPCRVLEVLITLAMHMYDIMLDANIYNSVSRWFWEIMDNIGLGSASDSTFSKETEDLVDAVVHDILSRTGVYGQPGGWFNINYWEDIEVWYQMHQYMSKYF